MLGKFFKSYLELPQQKKQVVCLGGGVGTAQILKGLRRLDHDLTAIVSMADDGGSAGRLRRAFAIPPPGDLVNCLAALSDEESTVNLLFLYRFSGPRSTSDTELSGQKLGNLIFLALTDIYKGDTNKALEELSKIISSRGRVLPATVGDVNIWAKTINGHKVHGESNIDLGLYNNGRTLREVHLDPTNIPAYKPAVEAIKNATVLIVGPGDLFSTVLPVMIVPQIKKQFKNSAASKFLITNIANKPFETAGFKVSNYLEAYFRHLGGDYLGKIIVNTNQKLPIPQKLKYQYVQYDQENLKNYHSRIITGDFVNEKYPLYHDSGKIAKVIQNLIQ